MTGAPQWLPVLLLFALLALAYLAMWRGWRRRAARHDLPPLEPVGAATGEPITASGRYFGSTVSEQWLERVVARRLGARSGCRLVVSDVGVDVHRPHDGFRIPAAALRGTRLEPGIAGKVVPPHGILVVTWQHGDLLLDSGFRLDALHVPGEPSRGAPSSGEIHATVAARVIDLILDRD